MWKAGIAGRRGSRNERGMQFNRNLMRLGDARDRKTGHGTI